MEIVPWRVGVEIVTATKLFSGSGAGAGYNDAFADVMIPVRT